MKVAIVGSRYWFNYPEFKKLAINTGLIINDTEIVSGGARGVDFMAKSLASELGLKFKEFPVRYGHISFTEAAHKRNQEIVRLL